MNVTASRSIYYTLLYEIPTHSMVVFSYLRTSINTASSMTAMHEPNSTVLRYTWFAYFLIDVILQNAKWMRIERGY